MSQANNGENLQILEYQEWADEQRTKIPTDQRGFITSKEQKFLQEVIYPMFYENFKEFKTSTPFPLILRDADKKPKYVIDNEHFTMVFLSEYGFTVNRGWTISFHIKDHNYCDKRIANFRNWLEWYHGHEFARKMTFENMPKKFRYPKLRRWFSMRNSKEERDFCIKLPSIAESDFVFYMLLDLMRNRFF